MQIASWFVVAVSVLGFAITALGAGLNLIEPFDAGLSMLLCGVTAAFFAVD